MKKLKLLLMAIALFVGWSNASAYTTADLTSAGWTQVTSLSDVNNYYYIFVDAGAQATAMFRNNDADARPFYNTLADPKENLEEVWVIAQNGENYNIKGNTESFFFNSGNAGWNDYVGHNNDNGNFSFTLNDGKYSIKSMTTGCGWVGPWNNDGAVSNALPENVACNKSEDQAPGFYLYSIARTDFEAQLVVARKTAASAATEGNPVDVTSYIINPSFTSKNAQGWTRTQTSVGNQQWGQQTMESWTNSNVSVTQQLSGVPNGRYKLTVDMISGNDDKTAYVYAKGIEEVNGDVVSAKTSAGDYTTMSNEVAGKTLTADNIRVTGNTVTVGFKAPTGWIVADNFKLYYYGPTVESEAHAFTSGMEVAADQWYCYDVPATGEYRITTTGNLNNISFQTNGATLIQYETSGATTPKEVTNLTAGPLYFKATSAASITIEPNSYAYSVGDATPSIADGDYISALSTISLNFADAATNDPDGTFALLNNTAKASLKLGDVEKAQGTLSLDGKVLTATFSNVTLDLNSTYTIEIASGVVGYEGQKANAAISTTFKTGIIAEGTYYFKRNGTENYITRGGNYGTENVVDKFGIALQATLQSDGTYTLKNIDQSLVSNSDKFLNSQYTDQGAYNWTIEAATGGYVLKRTDGKYITTSEEGTYHYNYFSEVDNAASAIVWTLLSKEQYIAAQTSRKNAEVAAIASANNLANVATEADLAANYGWDDMTSSITNATMSDNNDGWTAFHTNAQRQKKDDGDNAVIGRNNNTCPEVWNYLGGAKQTITSLPEGVYRITVKAVYRIGDDTQAGRADTQANPIAWMWAEAGATTNYTQIKSWAEAGKPGSTNDIKNSTNDDYVNTVYVTVGENEDLTIGITQPSWCGTPWLPFCGWTLAKLTDRRYVTDMTLSSTNATLTTGDGLTLTPTLTPNDADDQTITWTSSDETVATVADGYVKVLKAGIATITATANGTQVANSVQKTCTITAADAAAPTHYSAVAEGDFYIRNVATGKFLGGANSWGTQASIIKHGIPFTLTASDGKYTLDSHTYNSAKHFFDGTYVDGLSTPIYVTTLGDGKYALSTKDGSEFVTASVGSTVVDNSAANSTSTLAQWQFISANDKLQDLTSSTAENNGDATFYLQEANISRNLRMTSGNSAWKGAFTYGGSNDNQCAESINKTHDVYQTVSVPNGTYVVCAQGFYRPGASATASYLYANDQQVALKLYNAETLTAESMAGASTAFSAGRFWNQVEVTVTDNKLTVGIKTDATDSWTIWDNFEIWLKNTTGLNVNPAIADGDYYLTPDAGEKYIFRGADSGTQGTLSADNQLYATVKTDIAGISTVTFKDTNKRLFWNEEMVYTDGDQHVQKNKHHHYWAIEKVGDLYKLRNIETGLYLAVGEGVATATDEGSTWTFDTKATAEAITAAKTSATTIEGSHTLGFEVDEYAPYNNVNVIKAVAVAKALDAEGEYPALKLAKIKTAAESTWTANTANVDAIYNGNFALCENDGSMTGWVTDHNEGLGGAYHARAFVLASGAGNYDNLAAFGQGDGNRSCAYFRFDGTNSTKGTKYTYGTTEGYTMPLKTNTIYKLTAQAGGWGQVDKNFQIAVVNSSNENLVAQSLKTPLTGVNAGGSVIDYEMYFVVPADGNYNLVFSNGSTDADNAVVVSNIELLSTTALVFADGSVPTYAPGTYPTVKISRELTANRWATAVYPFSVSTTAVDNIAVLNSYNISTGELGFATADASTANEPFLMRSSANISEINLSNVAVEAIAEAPAVTKNDVASLKGTYTSIGITDAEKNYVLSDNTIYEVGPAGATINPYRAYIQMAEGAAEARSLTFVIDCEATAIKGIDADKQMGNGNVYNLKGQKVSGQLKKGVYVVDGKKVAIK